MHPFHLIREKVKLQLYTIILPLCFRDVSRWSWYARILYRWQHISDKSVHQIDPLYWAQTQQQPLTSCSPAEWLLGCAEWNQQYNRSYSLYQALPSNPLKLSVTCQSGDKSSLCAVDLLAVMFIGESSTLQLLTRALKGQASEDTLTGSVSGPATPFPLCPPSPPPPPLCLTWLVSWCISVYIMWFADSVVPQGTLDAEVEFYHFHHYRIRSS